jgi:hypothetical protein
MLPPAAGALQHDHPLAAVALLDDILARARSKAYTLAARYLKTLVARCDAETAGVGGIASHADYHAGLEKRTAEVRLLVAREVVPEQRVAAPQWYCVSLQVRNSTLPFMRLWTNTWRTSVPCRVLS